MKLQIADIRLKWDEIKAHVAALCEGHPERPEDIYAACVYGKASLLMCEDGYAICKLSECKYTGETIMWVWQASASIYGAIEKYLPELERFARENGAVVMQHSSQRLGWQRLHGWKASHTVYERRLDGVATVEEQAA